MTVPNNWDDAGQGIIDAINDAVGPLVSAGSSNTLSVSASAIDGKIVRLVAIGTRSGGSTPQHLTTSSNNLADLSLTNGELFWFENTFRWDSSSGMIRNGGAYNSFGGNVTFHDVATSGGTISFTFDANIVVSRFDLFLV